MKRVLSAALAGVIFGVGLVLAGMTDRLRVRAFLDVTGAWDPRLLLVMGFAILVFAPLYRLGRSRAPSAAVYASPSGAIDARLVAGAVLFGIGWGLVGYCPGPAVVALGASLVRFDGTAVIFCAAMIAGMGLHTLASRAQGRAREDA